MWQTWHSVLLLKLNSCPFTVTSLAHGDEAEKQVRLPQKLIQIMAHAPPGPLNDLELLISYAQDHGKTFIEIPMSAMLLKSHYMAHRDTINPCRWDVTGITKLKRKIRPFKHEFIVARLEYRVGDEVQFVRYLTLDRTTEKGNSPGLHLSGPSGVLNRAHIFSADNPATNTAANKILMLLARPDEAQWHLSLPGLLVLANQIHIISPNYRPLSTNCFWFADAMTKVLQRHGFVINQQSGNPSPHRSRLGKFLFQKSIATEVQINRVYNGFAIAQGRFFNFEYPAI